MGSSEKVRALVVQETSLGEQDKRLTLITVSRGCVYCTAKGAKKQNARLSAVSRLFVYGDFLLEQSRGGWYVKEASPIEFFYGLMQNPDANVWASWMVETARELAVENEECREMLKLLLRGLQMITEPSLSPRLVALTFVLRALAISGLRPETTHCLSCGKPLGREGALSSAAGGVICPECAHRYLDHIPVKEAGLFAFRHILEAEESVLYKFRVEEQTEEQLFAFTEQFLVNFLQREPTGLRFAKDWQRMTEDILSGTQRRPT